MGSLSRAQLVDWLKTLDITGKRVLDCGAGPKSKWACNWAQGEPAVYHTLDINAELEPEFVFDLNGRIQSVPFNHYDVAFLVETAEHLWNPLEALRNINRWLVLGGELYFSAPFINPIHDTVDYLRLTSEWWEKAAGVVGFDIDYIEPRVATRGEGLLREFYRAEGLRMSKIRLRAGEAYKVAHIGYYGRMTKR